MSKMAAPQHSVSATNLLIEDLRFDIPAELPDQLCTLQNSEQLVHNSGAKWKQHFAPQMGSARMANRDQVILMSLMDRIR